jgi:hypothetical protein
MVTQGIHSQQRQTDNSTMFSTTMRLYRRDSEPTTTDWQVCNFSTTMCLYRRGCRANNNRLTSIQFFQQQWPLSAPGLKSTTICWQSYSIRLLDKQWSTMTTDKLLVNSLYGCWLCPPLPVWTKSTCQQHSHGSFLKVINFIYRTPILCTLYALLIS